MSLGNPIANTFHQKMLTKYSIRAVHGILGVIKDSARLYIVLKIERGSMRGSVVQHAYLSPCCLRRPPCTIDLIVKHCKNCLVSLSRCVPQNSIIFTLVSDFHKIGY